MLIFGFRDLYYENGLLVREESTSVPGLNFDSVEKFVQMYIREHNMLLYSARRRELSLSA